MTFVRGTGKIIEKAFRDAGDPRHAGAEKGHSMNIGIIADSCCDLTPALRRLLKVDIVSLTIDVDGKQHVDNETLDTKRLLAEMKAYKGAPSTACPSPEAYADAMEQYDACFVVTLSGKLSGSCNAARIGREMLLERCPEKKIHVVDSESASAGQTLLAMLLRDRIDSGCAFETIAEEITAFVRRMQTRFVLEDLSNLVKNGRISRVAGLLGGALALRPIMGDDGHGGIVPIEKIRGTQNAMRRLVELIADSLRAEKPASRQLVLSYCNCPERAMALKKDLLEKCAALREVILTPTSGISTVYAYDGGVVLAY